MEPLIQTISNTPHPILVLVLIALGGFMLVGVGFTVFEVLIQDADAAPFDKIKKKSNVREKSDGSVGYP